jgi:protein SCO1/2
MKAFRVFARRRDDPDDPDGYAVPHTAITYLLAPDGSYVDHFTDALPAEEVTARIHRRLGESGTAPDAPCETPRP